MLPKPQSPFVGAPRVWCPWPEKLQLPSLPSSTSRWHLESRKKARKLGWSDTTREQTAWTTPLILLIDWMTILGSQNA